MSKEALIIIDMLNDFVLKGAPLEVPATRKVIPAVRKEIKRARARRMPVIYICDAHSQRDREFSKFGWPAHGVRGTRGAMVVDGLTPGRGDIIVKKTTYSCFYKTRLNEVLRDRGVKSLRITGCVTHICVLFIAYEAVLRDYTVSVVRNGVAGLSKEDHDAALRIMKNVLGVKLV